MSSLRERNIGAQFDILSKAVASRFHDLNSRSSYDRQTFQAYVTDYNQLASYGRTYSNVPYVARQWAAEEPRIRWTLKALEEKIVDSSRRRLDSQGNEYFSPGYSPQGYTSVPYTPSLYNDDVFVGGGSSNGVGSCGGCGGNNSTPATTINQRPNTIFPTGGINPPLSLGDMLRDLFGLKPQTVPLMGSDYPDSELLDQSGIFTGIVTAIIIGGVMFVIHQVTKKKS